MNIDFSHSLINKIEQLQNLAPDMHFGQLIATVGLLGEDSSGHGLWDLEDDEFLAAAERFRDDVQRRSAAELSQTQIA